MAARSNDHGVLEPQPPTPGPVLAVEFPGLRIGVAEYSEGPTGCTVFAFAAPVAQAVDVRGGSPGVVGDFGRVDAICLTGGSIYGLEAVTGVSAELLAQRGHDASWDRIALVSGAVIYDFGARGNTIYPDKALGRAALRQAQPGAFPLGPRGAGCSATAGKGLTYTRGELAGQGGAFRRIGDTRIAVFTVVNAVGVIVDRAGNVVRGGLDRRTGLRSSMTQEAEEAVARHDAPRERQLAPGNTTLTVLVTNRNLDRRALRQLGRQVHSSMARAIQPFHTIDDGDVFFTVTTAEAGDDGISEAALAVIASELAWDAVLASCVV